MFWLAGAVVTAVLGTIAYQNQHINLEEVFEPQGWFRPQYARWLRKVRRTQLMPPVVDFTGPFWATSDEDYDLWYIKAAEKFRVNSECDLRVRKKIKGLGHTPWLPYTIGPFIPYFDPVSDWIWPMIYYMQDTRALTRQVIENKLYASYVFDRLGVPTMERYYAAVAPEYAGRWPGLPAWNETEFLAAVMPKLTNPEEPGIVLKNLNCANSVGILVLDYEKYILENWTEDKLLDFARQFVNGSWNGCPDHYADGNTDLPAPHGFIVSRRYRAAPNLTATGLDASECYHAKEACNTTKTIVEFRAAILFGQLHMLDCHGGRCGPHTDPIISSVFGNGGRLGIPWPGDAYFDAYEPQRIMALLQQHLPQIRSMSEKIARTFAMDFIRVDWFMGGPEGLVLNELTYDIAGYTMGTNYQFLSRHARIMAGGYGLWDFAVEPRDVVLARLGCFATRMDDITVHCDPPEGSAATKP